MQSCIRSAKNWLQYEREMIQVGAFLQDVGGGK